MLVHLWISLSVGFTYDFRAQPLSLTSCWVWRDTSITVNSGDRCWTFTILLCLTADKKIKDCFSCNIKGHDTFRILCLHSLELFVVCALQYQLIVCVIWHCTWLFVLEQVHDEVILEGPEESEEEAMAIVVHCMSNPFNGKNILRVGLSVDAKCAKNWYSAK